MINFVKLIDQAVAWLDQQEGAIDRKLRDAIRCRLVLRRHLLYALDEEEDLRAKLTKHFTSCLALVPSLIESVSLGKRVPEAFSEKLQRKLASTVPPRPIVKINFEDALAHLKRLCQDAVNLQEVLDYRGPHNLRVRMLVFLFCLTCLTCLGCFVDPVIKKTSAFGLYSRADPNNPHEQYDGPGVCLC